MVLWCSASAMPVLPRPSVQGSNTLARALTSPGAGGRNLESLAFHMDEYLLGLCVSAAEEFRTIPAQGPCCERLTEDEE